MGDPTYDFHEAKRLVKQRRFRLLGKAARFIKNRYDGNPADVVVDVFSSLTSQDFQKTMELDTIPDVYADVYRPTYDGIEWYVKFYIENEVCVVVLSCNWDGCLH